jgi:hypothetical protein
MLTLYPEFAVGIISVTLIRMEEESLALLNEDLRFHTMVRILDRCRAGQSITNATKSEGISRATFYNWLREGVLDEYMRLERSAAFAQMANKAMESIPQVLSYMVRCATGVEAGPGINPVSAAKFVLEIAQLAVNGAAPIEPVIETEEKQSQAQQPQMVTNMVFIPDQFHIRVKDGRAVLDDDGRMQILDVDAVELN